MKERKKGDEYERLKERRKEQSARSLEDRSAQAQVVQVRGYKETKHDLLANQYRKMPLSEFRKKKLLYVFNAFFDVNQSGAIDKKDFDLAVQRICNSRHWSADNPKSTQTKDTLLKIWESLQQRADSDQDGQISRDEWYSMWEDYAKDPANAHDWQQTYMKFMFDLEDSSGDGSIDENEFSNVCHSHGVQEAEARDAFKKMGVGNEVTRDKFYELWKQYFTSDDPNAPGNFIFGKTSF